MTTERLESNLVTYLTDVSPSDEISIVNERQRAEIELPCLSVGASSTDRYAVALPGVLKVGINITLRCHAGDEADFNVASWQDQIETLLNDPTVIKESCTDGILIQFWDFQGATTSWDESVLETVYSAECLLMRI
jgi:hypothetical protein